MNNSRTSKGVAAAPLQGGFYSLVRALLGLYLTVHFIHLLPWAGELFSERGVLPAQLSPYAQFWFNPFDVDLDSLLLPVFVLGVVASLSLAVGYLDRLSGLYLIFLLAFLFMRNPLIANPSLPVVGWLLLAHCLLPRGNYGALHARAKPQRWVSWFYPAPMWWAAWFMLALAYTYSGYTKLLSPSWLDGSAIALVLDNPLARDHLLRDGLTALPEGVLQLLTWAVLVIELVFLPAVLFKRLRPWFWLAMLLIQLGFLTFLNFADLTTPMLLIHLLTFDPRWVKAKVYAQELNQMMGTQQQRTPILFFDGQCAFCSAVVQFALVEDRTRKIHFAPLFGQTYEGYAALPQADSTTRSDKRVTGGDSIVFLAQVNGREHAVYKSSAAARLLMALGGVWRVLGYLILCIPRVVRDAIYDAIGRVRYKLAGRQSRPLCQLLPEEYAVRVLP